MNDNHRELNKFLAMCELLIAIDKYKGGNGRFSLKLIKKYVDDLNTHIYEPLKFEENSYMNDLIEKIKRDDLYKELYFIVHEIKNRIEVYSGVKNNSKVMIIIIFKIYEKIN